jgi:hypothetical protein
VTSKTEIPAVYETMINRQADRADKAEADLRMLCAKLRELITIFEVQP